MSDLITTHIESFDGTQMAIHRMGEGRPVVLLHGLFSNADVNWIKYGHAAALAGAGFECIMPDWRVHGDSDAPTDPEAYPAGVLVRDAFAVVEALGLTDYDLVGFSLGARTSISAVLAGLTPRRLVISGMGLEGLTNWEKRVAFFIDMIDRYDEIERGDPAFIAKSFMKAQGIDPVAARLLLTRGVEQIDTAKLSTIAMPTMVLIGDEDRDNGSPERLADALPDAFVETIAGNHMSCVTQPGLSAAIVRFLSA
ncbi:alpha/beta fold hydrolase [Aurantiacibacter marinus]|uniref:Hydrolase n=1 Tax=Aurantiacibacter marinus TaxID=874156 RepID=A0A0H0XMS9_9SPHN|nr:alpha/beta fold hydrolase [Aurantiacibacter marinus]KLI63669.1 hydrolase [Aurantiacibacter marinus]